MVLAYVLIDAAPGKDKEICGEVLKIKGVKEAHLVTGPHDIVATVEVQDMRTLGEVVWTKIRSIRGVARSLTLTVTE